MLKDAKARDPIAAFHANYALMGDGTRWAAISHDSTLFPASSRRWSPL